jgi:hypothetical protein
LTCILLYATMTSHFTKAGENMKRFLVLSEIEIDDKKYDDLVKDGFEPTDFVISVLADHGRSRGLIIKMRCMETEYHLLDEVSRSADAIAKDKAIDELEEVMLNNTLCPSGNCEA